MMSKVLLWDWNPWCFLRVFSKVLRQVAEMVSASIEPAKTMPALRPDQLKSVPARIPVCVARKEFAIMAAIGKLHTQPGEPGQDEAAAHQADGLGRALGINTLERTVPANPDACNAPESLLLTPPFISAKREPQGQYQEP
jgi:hypothetical protein